MVDGTVKFRPYISVIMRVVGAGEAGFEVTGAAAEEGTPEVAGEDVWGICFSALQPIRLILRTRLINTNKMLIGILFFISYSMFQNLLNTRVFK